MASSFISKDNKFGFWIHDSIFQVACRVLYNVINSGFNNVQSEVWTDRLKTLLDNNSKGLYHSYMHLELDELIINEERKIVFSNFCKQSIESALLFGDVIELKILNEWYDMKLIAYHWVSSLETSRLIKVFGFLDDLINDKINIRASDEIDYEF